MKAPQMLLGPRFLGAVTPLVVAFFTASAQFGQHQLNVGQFRGQAFLFAGEVRLETGRLLG